MPLLTIRGRWAEWQGDCDDVCRPHADHVVLEERGEAAVLIEGEVLQAFRLAASGQSYLHPRLGAQMASSEQSSAGGVALSEREREVVKLIANGYTNPQIAEQLQVAERTVKTYRARAIEKLGFSSRAEITAYVRRTGLAD